MDHLQAVGNAYLSQAPWAAHAGLCSARGTWPAAVRVCSVRVPTKLGPCQAHTALPHGLEHTPMKKRRARHEADLSFCVATLDRPRALVFTYRVACGSRY